MKKRIMFVLLLILYLGFVSSSIALVGNSVSTGDVIGVNSPGGNVRIIINNSNSRNGRGVDTTNNAKVASKEAAQILKRHPINVTCLRNGKPLLNPNVTVSLWDINTIFPKFLFEQKTAADGKTGFLVPEEGNYLVVARWLGQDPSTPIGIRKTLSLSASNMLGRINSAQTVTLNLLSEFDRITKTTGEMRYRPANINNINNPAIKNQVNVPRMYTLSVFCMKENEYFNLNREDDRITVQIYKVENNGDEVFWEEKKPEQAQAFFSLPAGEIYRIEAYWLGEGLITTYYHVSKIMDRALNEDAYETIHLLNSNPYDFSGN